MDEIREKSTIIQEVPTSSRPVVASEYEQVVYERQGLSGAAIAAIVLGIVIAGIIITMLIVNSQSQTREDELALAQQRAAAAERSAADAQRSASQAAQQQTQQPPIVVMPQTQPLPVPTPAPSTSESSGASSRPSSLDIEVNINSKLLDDRELSSYPINVKVENGVPTLSGEVPTEDLKSRAERLAKTVKGVSSVINNITIREA